MKITLEIDTDRPHESFMAAADQLIAAGVIPKDCAVDRITITVGAGEVVRISPRIADYPGTGAGLAEGQV